MIPGSIVKWFGYDLIVVAFVCEIDINIYFWATLNGVENIYSIRVAGHENDGYFPPARHSKTYRSTKKERRWLNLHK
jgi:hypothetical protein